MQVLVEYAEVYEIFLQWEVEGGRGADRINKLYEDARNLLITHDLPEDISDIITNIYSRKQKVCRLVYVLGKVMCVQDYFSFRRAELSKGPASLDRVRCCLLFLIE